MMISKIYAIKLLLLPITESNNSQFFIFENSKIAPVGVPGEIYVASTQLAQGYYDSSLAKQNFMQSPFNKNFYFI